MCCTNDQLMENFANNTDNEKYVLEILNVSLESLDITIYNIVSF